MHFFLLPTVSCNSACKYCFGNQKGTKIMPVAVLRKAIKLFKDLSTNSEKVQLTFHGGEPLLAGTSYYKEALRMINHTLGNNVNLGVQSNLWLLNHEWLKLFKRYRVSIGTSIDGPEIINDYNRSKGYFNKTIKGLDMLSQYGVKPSCIATFTTFSANKYKEVFDFFIKNKMPFEIHPAVKPFDCKDNKQLFLNPEDYGQLLINLLEYYLPNTDKIKIGTLDTLIKNVSNDKSGLCTFTKCLGNYLAIDPLGDLYTCNRFVGNKSFCVGNLATITSWSDIKKSLAWQKLEKWQQFIDNECSDCLHKNICHGGCPYSAFAASNGEYRSDPNCHVYKMIYNLILDKATEEFFREENLKAFQNKGSSHLRKGALLKIMNNNPHPFDIANQSKIIVSSVLLAQTNSPAKVTEELLSLGITDSKEKAKVLIKNLHQGLISPQKDYINLYLHITGDCNLACSHCYAYPTSSKESYSLSIEKILEIIKTAADLKFRKIIITGGEPLLHPEFSNLLEILIELKKQERFPKLVLRTNLTLKFERETLLKIGNAFDQIAVSIDGTESLHDKRRGQGSYLKVIKNINSFDEKTRKKKITLSTTFNYNNTTIEDINKIKAHIFELKEQFQLLNIRFSSVMPIGRARGEGSTRPTSEIIGVPDWISQGNYAKSSCGIGFNLMINYDGNIYPCHVFNKSEFNLGNVNNLTIDQLIKTKRFTDLRQINVNTFEKCMPCKYKYLCGGGCKAWGDSDCSELYKRAENLYFDALKILKVYQEEIN